MRHRPTPGLDPDTLGNTPAPEQPATLRDAIGELFETYSVCVPATVLDEVCALSEEDSMARTCEALRLMLTRLTGTAAEVALRRVALGEEGQTLREASKEARCSHVRLHELQRKIRAKLSEGG